MSLSVSQEYPILNDVAPSWADVSVTFNFLAGETFKNIEFSEIKWTSKVDKGEQRGASGGRVMKRTTGAKTDEGSCVWYKAGLWRLLSVVVPYAPVRGNQRLISQVPFNVIILHTSPGSDTIIHEEMRGCTINSFESSMSEGTDAEKVPMDLKPIETAWVLADGTEVVLL